MAEFIHLHLHTEYSLLDGAIRIKDLPAMLKSLDMKAAAITDHGYMYGAVEFYKTMKANGIKPIIGCEVYVARRGRKLAETKEDVSGYHLVLLAENNEGYRNLIKIVSIGSVEGYYYRPRVDYEVLQKYSKGIIALSACMSGEVAVKILADDPDGAELAARRYADIFGKDNFYLELQDHGIDGQRKINNAILKLSDELNIPAVVTNDAHYMTKNDAEPHEVLLCMQTGKTIRDADRMKMNSDGFYLKSGEEMQRLFQYAPQALENTAKIAERCNVELDFQARHLPEFDLPEGKTAFGYLEELCLEGLRSRYPGRMDDTVVKRLNYELEVIRDMGFIDYFLITRDVIAFARSRGIPVGPGRGSAAGSIVSYSLGITDIDPIKYNLIFERFLNPERVTMPDIDTDICDERRNEVKEYLAEKYGADRVAQIIALGTLATKAVIKDVGRALGLPYSYVDKISKMIPRAPDQKTKMTLDKALEINPELNAMYNADLDVKRLFDIAKRFEGMPKNASTHAAGIVITTGAITDYVPVQRTGTSGAKKGREAVSGKEVSEEVRDIEITTQYTMTLIEELGLLKMDFLGLRTLSVIEDAARMAGEHEDREIDINNIDMDDPDVYRMIGEGKNSGVFQLESSGMSSFMKELKPTGIEDIVAGVSLYRPGPMYSIPAYLANKRDPSKVRYDHPILENILDVTYGCIVYQEQVMQIVREVAGYSMGRADLVRRAMSKKKADVMEKEREYFIKGAGERGVDCKTANVIFNKMIDFASYAFNKSHAAAYALVTYRTAWLKCHYPVEFMAAMLNSFLMKNDRIAQYVEEARSSGIEVLPPDINESDLLFNVVNGKIRFGLAAIKNVGEKAVEEIIDERKANGRFKSFHDVCKRLNGKGVNKKCFESLIKAGVFSEFPHNRAQLIASYERIIDKIASANAGQYEGQLFLFDSNDEKSSDSSENEADFPAIKDYSQKILLSMEKEMTGIYISGHPLKAHERELKRICTFTSSDIRARMDAEKEAGAEAGDLTDGLSVKIGGIITVKKDKITKNNNLMAFVTVEDFQGQMELLVFPKILNECKKTPEVEDVIIVEGNLSVKDESDVKIIAERITDINDVEPPAGKTAGKLFIRLTPAQEMNEWENIRGILSEHKGDVPVYLYVERDAREKRMAKALPCEYNINVNEVLLRELGSRYGEDNVKVTGR